MDNDRLRELRAMKPADFEGQLRVMVGATCEVLEDRQPQLLNAMAAGDYTLLGEVAGHLAGALLTITLGADRMVHETGGDPTSIHLVLARVQLTLAGENAFPDLEM